MRLETTTPRESGSDEKADWRVFPLQVAALAGVYVASGWFGLGFAFQYENVSLIWPPSGLCLAALIIWGPRLWIGVWLGTFGLSLINGSPVPVAVGFAVGNTLMAVVGSWLLVHVFDLRASLERVRDVLLLVFVGGALAAMISAGVGVATLWLHGSVATSEIGAVLAIWWPGDLGGVVAIAPLVLLLKGGGAVWRNLFREAEFWIATAVGVVLLVFAYSGLLPHDQERFAVRLTSPLLFWVAVRLGMRGTVLLNLAVMLVSSVALAQGLGPLAAGDPYSSTGLLWIYLMTTGVTSLVLAAAIAQREVAEEQHRLEIVERLRIERGQMIAKERESILRDMHDGIGGQLISVLSMVQRGSATNDEVAEALRRTLDDMRIMIDSLDASNTSFPQMIGRLRARLDSVLKRNGLRATWQIEPLEALGNFNPKQALDALRIIQEAVANVVQHAHASEIEIRIYATDPSAQTIAIEISDNGVGSDSGATAGGLGTRNMNARAEALGAELRFEIRDSGRLVSLFVPVSSLG